MTFSFPCRKYPSPNGCGHGLVPLGLCLLGSGLADTRSPSIALKLHRAQTTIHYRAPTAKIQQALVFKSLHHHPLVVTHTQTRWRTRKAAGTCYIRTKKLGHQTLLRGPGRRTSIDPLLKYPVRNLYVGSLLGVISCTNVSLIPPLFLECTGKYRRRRQEVWTPPTSIRAMPEARSHPIHAPIPLGPMEPGGIPLITLPTTVQPILIALFLQRMVYLPVNRWYPLRVPVPLTDIHTHSHLHHAQALLGISRTVIMGPRL